MKQSGSGVLYRIRIYSLPSHSPPTKYQQGKLHDAYHGYTVTVLGQNFMDIVSITMGNRSVALSTVTVSEANDMLTFTMPRAPQGTCSLAITTMGGTAEVPGFYPLENIVLNYDNIGWFSWGGQAAPITADGTAAPFFSDGKCYSISGELSAWNYWWGQLQNGAVWGIDAASCLLIHRLPNWLCNSNVS